jgi:ketosteroid isomerase-like protein
MFGGESTAFRGHEEIREFLRDLDDAFAEFQIEISEIRDLGERLVTIGHIHGRGKVSGADVESPIGYIVDFKNGKAVRYRDYFDPTEALEAAGLPE